MHIKLNDIFLTMQQQLDTPRAVLDENLLIELVNRIRPIRLTLNCTYKIRIPDRNYKIGFIKKFEKLQFLPTKI